MSGSCQGKCERRLTYWPRFSSFKGQARPIQEFFKAVGDGLAVGAAAIVVKEDDGGVFCPLVGSGNPIPASAAGVCKAKPGTQFILVRQLVEGFDVQRLETINGPTFRP